MIFSCLIAEILIFVFGSSIVVQAKHLKQSVSLTDETLQLLELKHPDAKYTSQQAIL